MGSTPWSQHTLARFLPTFSQLSRRQQTGQTTLLPLRLFMRPLIVFQVYPQLILAFTLVSTITMITCLLVNAMLSHYHASWSMVLTPRHVLRKLRPTKYTALVTGSIHINIVAILEVWLPALAPTVYGLENLPLIFESL